MAKEEFPESYKDPLYAQVDARTEQKLGLPPGVLSGIRERGERSNHSQVSSAAASSVYQFIPSTRKAILDKYGIDVALSPQNASEGAGLLIKEGLERNKGDIAQAVGEYTGGLDRKNWGPVTKAYINRVTGLRQPVAEEGATAPQKKPMSTFDRVQASMSQQVSGPQIANIYQAYQSGQMSPEEAAQFEGDVKSGIIMLPRGAALKGGSEEKPSSAPDQATELPQAVVDAYRLGKMSPDEKGALERDIANGVVKWPRGEKAAQGVPLPPAVPEGTPIPAATAPISPDVPTSLGDKLIGAGEAALNVGTGMTGGVIGTAGGAVKGLAQSILDGSFGTPEAANLIEKSAVEGGHALTYAPRTASGVQQAQAVASVGQQLLPVAGLAGEVGSLATAARPVAQAPRAAVATAARNVAEAIPAPIADAARSVGGGVAQAAQTVASGAKTAANAVTAPISSVTGKVRQALSPRTQEPTPGTAGSAGAAGTDVATMRRMNAQDLPEPINLTEGQATRQQGQQTFERETAKTPEIGAPLRERFAEQNEQLLQNFDHFIDQTGAKATSLREVGTTVDSALVKQFNADKNKVNAAYAKARNSPEASALVDQELPVSIGEGETALSSTPIQFLNEQPSGVPASALADSARQLAVKLGIAEMRDGQLVPRPTTISKMEEWRKAIGDSTGYEKTDIRTATILKKLIDGQTEPVAGPIYRQARALRQRLAQNYEDISVIDRLLTTKRGTSDRRVAFEDIFDHSIMDGSLDDVRQVRRVLQRGGEEGQQAWRELQGQTLQTIKDQMTKNVARDERGNPVVSAPAMDKIIQKLDADGKLDFIFGKRGAEQLRVINDVAKDVLVSNPGAVNTSNNAHLILAAMDMAVSSMAGLPLPIGSGLRMLARNIKDRQLKARVEDALGGKNKGSKF